MTKRCDGTVENPTIKESRAFCEGRAARAASVSPTNPHAAGSDDADAWDRGVADKVANPTVHGCCGPTGAAAV